MTQKTIRELIAEMDSRQVSMEEIEAARKYEKSLIPDDILIPSEGSVYETHSSVECTSMVQFSAPFTGGKECMIPKGVRVKVLEHFDEKPIVITCVPIESDELSSFFVDPEDLKSELYAGYYLSVPTLEFIKSSNEIPHK